MIIGEAIASAREFPVLQRELEEYAEQMHIPLCDRVPPAVLKKGFLSSLVLKEPDLPGIIYQALRMEGNRIQSGAYYTPRPIIRDLLKAAGSSKAECLMDPCCGSGLFLCEYALAAGRPDSVRGIDRDRNAVLLARINLFVRFPDIQDLTGIRHSDALAEKSWGLPGGSVIATNPPWGAPFYGGGKKES